MTERWVAIPQGSEEVLEAVREEYLLEAEPNEIAFNDSLAEYISDIEE